MHFYLFVYAIINMALPLCASFPSCHLNIASKVNPCILVMRFFIFYEHRYLLTLILPECEWCLRVYVPQCCVQESVMKLLKQRDERINVLSMTSSYSWLIK